MASRNRTSRTTSRVRVTSSARNGSKSRTSRLRKAAPKDPGKESKEIGKVREPQSPMPAQHQEKPGIESKLTPRPRYEPPHYKGADKLKAKVALITGGDSGIGRAVAVLFAREGADVAVTYLPEEERDAIETRQAVEQRWTRVTSLAKS